MTDEDDNDIDPRLEEAARWHVQFADAEGGAAHLPAFRSWLAEDKRNLRAFERTRRTLIAIEKETATPELIAIRRTALARVEQGGEIEIVREPARGRRRAAWTAGLSALAASLALFVGWTVYGPGARPVEYATGADERRTVTLADGSRVALDRGTRIAVRMERGARRIELLEGQAQFRVAHDRSRPFTVVSGTHSVLATGTDFNVERPRGRSIVTLLEGRVVVQSIDPEAGLLSFLKPAPAGPAPRELRPGEQYAARDSGPVSVRSGVKAEEALAWQRGRLSFTNEPLGIAIARFSRYKGPPIVLSDSRDAELRVSGVFEVDNSRGFAASLPQIAPLRMRIGEGGVLLLDHIR